MTGTQLMLLMVVPLLAGSVIAFGLDAFDRRRTALAVAIAGLLVTGVAGIWGGLYVGASSILGVVRVGGATSALPGVIALCGALALLGGSRILAERPGGGTTAGLVALGAAAAGAMVAAIDLTTLLLAVEVSAVISYALVSESKNTRSDEAAMKYFVQGSVATGIFVMGMAVLVGLFAPSGHYTDLPGALSDPAMTGPAIVGILLTVSALAFKAGLAPFHTWAPDAYESAPPSSAAFLATGPKLGAIAALTVFVAAVATRPLAEKYVPILLALSIVSVIVGSVGALGQRSYLRMLAYAGIAQAGYALLAVSLFDLTSTAFFLSTYAVASVGVFLAADAFRAANPSWDGTIAGMAGMGRTAPVASTTVGVFLVSLAGIPPLLGFWGKFQVFATAVYGSASELLGGGSALIGWMLAIAVVVALLGSVISIGYYGSVLRSLYLLAAPSEPELPARQGRALPVVLVCIAAIVVVLGIAPAIWGYSFLVTPFVKH